MGTASRGCGIQSLLLTAPPNPTASDSDIVSSQSWQVDWDDGEENLEFSWEDQAHIVMGP